MGRTQRVDLHIGRRVRLARLANGMSQAALAEAVGVTFQQIQKYEKGTNRVSAGRLAQFAGILGVDLGYFFDGVNPGVAFLPAATPTSPIDFSKVDIDILRQLSGIDHPQLKRKLLALIGHLTRADRAKRPPSEA